MYEKFKGKTDDFDETKCCWLAQVDVENQELTCSKVGTRVEFHAKISRSQLNARAGSCANLHHLHEPGFGIHPTCQRPSTLEVSPCSADPRVASEA